jgi:hypothetical protein
MIYNSLLFKENSTQTLTINHIKNKSEYYEEKLIN